MPGVCRVGDSITATCSIHGAITGTWPPNAHDTSKADGINMVLVGDTAPASCGATLTATTGSTITTVNGIGVHRVGDAVSVSHGGVGTSSSGSTIVNSD